MAFALVENDVITEYPLNLRQHLHSKRVSAPRNKYQELGIYEVKTNAYPEFNRYTQKVVAQTPVYSTAADEVIQSWAVAAMTTAELTEFDQQWRLAPHQVRWLLRKHHWDRDIWNPVVVYLQSQHTSGSASEYADFASLLDRPTIAWSAFMSAYQIIQSTAVLAGVTTTLPTIGDMRSAWQDAETYVAPY